MGSLTYFCVACVSLVFVSASIIPNAEETSVHRKARAASCRVDGSLRPDGSNFTRLATGPCVFYTCSNGEVLPAGYGCYRGGQCYPLGDEFNLGCTQRQCDVYNGRFDYVVKKEGCVARDGVSCVDVGSTFKDGCFTYICEKEQQTEFSVSYHTREIGWGCELEGRCVTENHTVTQNCHTAQCQRRGIAVGFYSISQGCQIADDCLDVGQSTVIECRTLTCSKETFNGIELFNVKPTKIQCKDADDVCHESGEFFPMSVNRQRQNCTCRVHDMAIAYSCPIISLD